MPLRLVFAEDNFLVREGTSALLAESEDLEVVAAVANAVELLDAVSREQPRNTDVFRKIMPLGLDPHASLWLRSGLDI